VTFRRGAKLNPGQVRDLRGVGGRRVSLPGGLGGLGGGGGSGGGIPIPIGGGIGGIIVLLVVVGIIFFMNGGLGGGGTTTNPGGGGLVEGPTSTNLEQDCQTGADANERMDCRIVGFVNSIQAYWSDFYASRGAQYREATTTLFDGFVDTGCGQASSDVGPFYCPLDENVYLDLGFFSTLEERFGASAGSLAQGYVVAHEYGHHIENLQGILSRSQDGTTGPTSSAVRVELMADCYAGVWVANAVDTGYLEPISQTEVDDALSAAAAVGDDRIQRAATGSVNPESWTHGSSEQRVGWFTTGYRTGDPDTCDTFSQQP
jgi:predicted metalloprotease